MKGAQTNAKIIMHPATVEYYNDRRIMFEIKPYSKREMRKYTMCVAKPSKNGLARLKMRSARSMADIILFDR